MLLKHGPHELSMGICSSAKSISFLPLSWVLQDCFSPFVHLPTVFSSPLLLNSVLLFLKSVLQRHSQCCCGAWLWWGCWSTGLVSSRSHSCCSPLATYTHYTIKQEQTCLFSNVCGFMMCSYLMCSYFIFYKREKKFFWICLKMNIGV